MLICRGEGIAEPVWEGTLQLAWETNDADSGS